jgi:biopolymer transport protein ExbB
MSSKRGRRRADVAAWGLALILLWFCALSAPPAARAQGVDDSGSATAAAGPADESFLGLMWRRAGVIELVIGGMSFYLIALVVWMSFQYRKPVAVPGDLVRDLNDLLAQKRYGEAYQRLAASSSFLSRVLAAGVRKLPTGHAAAVRALELANDDATMEMEHRTTYLATVGTLGPMIGLVGTVYGMILSFRVIASAGSSPQASQLAAGISTALFATLEGIALSIPAIYFYGLFRNRIARLSLEVAMAAESLLEQFSPGVRTPHPLAAAATAMSQQPAGPTRSALPPNGG